MLTYWHSHEWMGLFFEMFVICTSSLKDYWSTAKIHFKNVSSFIIFTSGRPVNPLQMHVMFIYMYFLAFITFSKESNNLLKKIRTPPDGIKNFTRWYENIAWFICPVDYKYRLFIEIYFKLFCSIWEPFISVVIYCSLSLT